MWTFNLSGVPWPEFGEFDNKADALRKFKEMENAMPSYGNRVLHGPNGEIVNSWELPEYAI